MQKQRKKTNISKNEEPIAKKVKDTIKNSVLNTSDVRTKKFPKHLPVSNYVAIKPKKFKEMQYKK